MIGGNLDEQPAAGVALVELTGGVQEARPVAAGHSQPGALAQLAAQSQQAGIAGQTGRDISLESEISARGSLLQEAAPDFGQ